ncbi:hypothetical protein ACWIBQ_07580 [Microbacterium keratanolyticum]
MSDDEKQEEPTGKRPLLWSPDGHNLLPTSWKAWLIVAAGAVALGVIVAWLS